MLKALAFNCSLKPADDAETSSTDALLFQLVAQLQVYAVATEIVRAVDLFASSGKVFCNDQAQQHDPDRACIQDHVEQRIGYYGRNAR